MVAKQRSRDAMNLLTSMRSSITSKWNKKLVANLESPRYQANNIGTSFLTSPVNYSKQQPVIDLLESNKEKLLSDIEKYKPRESATKKKMINPSQARVESLAKTFADNFPGKFKNGRPLLNTEFDRLAVTQITSPIVKSPRNVMASKTAMSKTHFNSSSIQNLGTKKDMDSAWKTTLSP